MYIQLTTRCNMKCDHCCFSATTRGSDMEYYTFMSALQLAARCGDPITIGGGEPTIHKEFFEFLDKAIESFECGSLEFAPFLVTNGKLKTKALKLLNYVEEGRPLHVELSQDPFHDPIDPYVVQRYRAHDRNKRAFFYSGSSNRAGGAGIRDTSANVQPWGRAKETGVWNALKPMIQECVCDDAFVDPEGRVWSCGCKHTQLGWVWEKDVLDNYDREYAHQGGRDPEPKCEEDLQGDGLQEELLAA